MNRDETIAKLRELDIQYVRERVGADPSALPQHLAEYLGYATILYDHYSEYIKSYEITEGKVIAEENDVRQLHNVDKIKRDEKMTVAEVEQRIEVRLASAKGERKRLELAVKGATLHINGVQSLMNNFGDEAKGIR